MINNINYILYHTDVQPEYTFRLKILTGERVSCFLEDIPQKRQSQILYFNISGFRQYHGVRQLTKSQC